MPCCELFDQQDADYHTRTLRPDTVTIAIEAGATGLWRQYVGTAGEVIGLDVFGASAPGPDVYTHFGITVNRVVETVNSLLNARAAA